MSKITDKDRKDYERGQQDAKEPFLERNINDHGRSNESDAYRKGREGRDLDDDKKK